MENPETINQQKLKEILMNIYIIGMEEDSIRLKDVIDEIKKQLLEHSQ